MDRRYSLGIAAERQIKYILDRNNIINGYAVVALDRVFSPHP